jgi:hypothetical protein
LAGLGATAYPYLQFEERRGIVRPTFAILSVTMLLAACSSSPGASAGVPSSGGAPSQAAASPAASGEPTPGTALTACELVSPADIEAALSLDAGTVSEGVLEQQGTVLDPATNECRYADDSWGGLVVRVTPTDGVNTFDALVKVYGKDAEAIEVGDGALWFEDNDRGYFLQGSVMVILQFTFMVDGTPFRDPTIALGEALVAKI